MNDRYLFKAKRKMWKKFPENEHWIIWDAITGKPREAILNKTICQCTGLKDKSGNLIWENDVVKCGDNIGKIGWNETHLAYTILANVNGNMLYYFIDETLGEEAEVVGNIFDNPELLEVE